MEDKIDTCYCYFVGESGNSHFMVDKFCKHGSREATLGWSVSYAVTNWKVCKTYCIFEVYNIKLQTILQKVYTENNVRQIPEEMFLVIEMIRNNPELGKIHLEKGMI